MAYSFFASYTPLIMRGNSTTFWRLYYETVSFTEIDEFVGGMVV